MKTAKNSFLVNHFILFLFLFTLFVSFQSSKTIFAQQSNTLSCGEEKTVFVTKTSDVTYYNITLPEKTLYRFRACSTSDQVSMILANADGEIYDIIDSSQKSGGTYNTTSIRLMNAGDYLLGLSVTHIAKVTVLAEPLTELQEGQTITKDLTKQDITTGYLFTPTETKQYQFYYASNRSQGNSSLKLYNQNAKQVKTANKEYFSQWNGELFLLNVKLKAGKTYYLFINGKPKGKNPREEITVSEWLNKDGKELSEDKEIHENIAHYYERNYYKFTPSETGNYFFRFTTDTDYYPSFSVYNENETRISSKTLKLYGYSEDEGTLLKREVTLKLKAGKTYYICTRLEGYQTGYYRFKIKKLSPVKKITVIHKPIMKEYVKDLDKKFDLSGTVLTIRYKDGRSAKWIYDKKIFYKNACKIECSTSQQGNDMVATFTFRSKSVDVKIPIIKVQTAYQSNGILTTGESKTLSLKKHGWNFMKFTPTATTIYRFHTMTPESNSYRFVIFDQDGNMIKSKYSSSAREGKRYYETLSCVKGLEQGKDYYIGAEYQYSNSKGILKITPVDLTPTAVSNVNIAIDNTEAIISFDKQENADGYQIVYYNEKHPDKRIRAFTIYRSGNYVYDLKPGTTYYFKVRAYREESGKKYYGPFSSISKITI